VCTKSRSKTVRAQMHLPSDIKLSIKKATIKGDKCRTDRREEAL